MVEHYSKNFINEVILKMDFFHSINVEDFIDEFFENINEKFKFKDIKSDPQISINITNQEGKINTTFQPSAWYFFQTEDVNDSPYVIEVTKDYILVDFRANIKKYERFEIFGEYIDILINSLSIFKIDSVKSMGLRYINTISCNEGNPLIWGNIISEKLLLTDLLKTYDSPSRLMHNFLFEKNDFRINFTFGIFNTEFPNPIARKEYILDFDCLCYDDLNIYEVKDTVEDMHSTIYELFDENITDSFKNYLRSEDDD